MLLINQAASQGSSHGLTTFFHVIIVLAIIGAVVFFAYLFRSAVKRLIELLKSIPQVVYEVLLYALSLGCLVGGYVGVEGTLRPYMGFIGCLLFVAALGFTSAKRKLDPGNPWFGGTLFVVCAAATIAFDSPLTGFMAVAALFWTLGFAVEVFPLCYAFGFKSDSALGKATSAAFAILAVFVGMRIAGISNDVLNNFEIGALFMGSFVGYLGLLIASSRWYNHRNNSYVLFQLITIVAGIAALFVGSVFAISELQKIGGTFFVIFYVEKLIELLSTKKISYALWGLVLCVIAIALSLYSISHLAIVSQYLPVG